MKTKNPQPTDPRTVDWGGPNHGPSFTTVGVTQSALTGEPLIVRFAQPIDPADWTDPWSLLRWIYNPWSSPAAGESSPTPRKS